MSSKRMLLVFVAALAVVGASVVLFALRGELGVLRGEPTQVPWAEVDRDSGYVIVEGTAHYPVHVKQTYQPTWLRRDPPTQYIFPLFGPGDTMSREIRILVLSQVAPDRMLGLQDLNVRGEIRRPTSRLLTRGVLDTFREHSYQFADDFLLLIADPPPGD